MKKQATGIALAAAMITTMLTACSGGAQPQQSAGTQSNPGTGSPPPQTAEPSKPAAVSSPAAGGGKVTINFWHSMGGKNGEYIDAMIKSFNESQNKIEVVGTFQGAYAETLTKLQQAIPAKTAPDIAMVERGFIPLLADADVLEDINPYLKKSGMSKDDFVPGLMGNITFNNKLVALPFNRSTAILHVNKTMLDEKGLEIPKTWDDLKKVANALVIKENNEYKRYGYSMVFESWHPVAMIVQQKGRYINQQGTSIGFGMEGINAFKFLKEMQSTGALYYPPAKDSGSITSQMFISGQIGMLYSSTGNIGSFINNAKFNYATAFLPMKDTYGSPTGGANIALLSQSKNKDAAWEFIHWAMTDPKGAQQFIMSSGYLPFTKKMVDSPEMKALWQKEPQRQVAYDQLQYAIDTSDHIQFPAIDQEFLKMQSAIMYDNADIAASIENFKKEAERLMKN
ncbi:ABC transporter substrate-binding protein [Paenibacillus thalictri]|uniref:Extracellular solute-binding protein n=1 Tax=Paenibacillus thalictri TaxID=2527873 RepID=A0A4Q9DK62_9BACL|nr:ABC transporter substrate-binding protein [Paenibacillus thalictri]TBL73958.1 extracellular solute-binding protein [Paenibacillus thalictri]